MNVGMIRMPGDTGSGRWGLLLLRLVVGFGFMAHGAAKLSRGPEGFARLLRQVGAPFPTVMAWAGMLLELFGGAAIFAGAFVAVVGPPLIVMMLVAMFTVHLRYGFSAIKTIGLTADGPQFGPPGYEVNLLYIASLVALMVAGAGAWSVDRMLAERRESSRALAGRRVARAGHVQPEREEPS